MRTVLLIGIAALVFGQPKDVDGWQGLRWGMSISEAQKILGDNGQAVSFADNPAYHVQTRLRIKEVTLENLRGYGSVMAPWGLDSGATRSEVMRVTGWEAHSVRGFVSAVIIKKLKRVVESTAIAFIGCCLSLRSADSRCGHGGKTVDKARGGGAVLEGTAAQRMTSSMHNAARHLRLLQTL